MSPLEPAVALEYPTWYDRYQEELCPTGFEQEGRWENVADPDYAQVERQEVAAPEWVVHLVRV